MSFESLLTKTAEIKRLEKILGTNRSTYQTVGSIACMIQPLSAEEVSIVGGVFGKTFRLYCRIGENIKDTDKLTVDSQDYLVKGIQDYDFGRIPHKEILIQSVVE